MLMDSILVRDPEKIMAENCYMIEKETHNTVDGNFPVSKYLAIIKLMNEDNKKQKKSFNESRMRKHG
jgi:predicted class III extradiol MEMO1 family dioxygenase